MLGKYVITNEHPPSSNIYAPEYLIKLNVYSKGMFYKKGHLVRSWKNRSWVVNDFSSNNDMPEHRDGRFRYYKPQEVR